MTLNVYILAHYFCRNSLTCVYVYFENYNLNSVDGIFTTIGFSLEFVTI